MRTRTVSTDAIDEIVETLREGGPVALPTETVYGLAAPAGDPDAVRRIFEVKGRPADNPLIVHAADAHSAFELVAGVPDYARRLAEAFWPGPLTLVLASAVEWPWVQAGHSTLAIRVPEPAYLREVLRRSGPLAAPSANRSGRPSPTTAGHCRDDLDGLIPLIVDGGPARGGMESTVVDCTGAEPVVLRPGPVTPDDVRNAAGAGSPSTPRAPLGAVAQESSGSGSERHAGAASTDRAPASPGTRHPHYRPRARVILVADGSTVSCRDCMVIAPSPAPVAHPRAYETLDQLGRQLYGWFREADALGVSTIYVERVPESGLGIALMNRLGKAAE
ncbi:MAG TPA: L-threonylcarbamoyladenylate synthase [Longimicrobiales bacterium]|nr:L-threonylcarbamoyladenylate synthase [Longimicrobiales bacterium]